MGVNYKGFKIVFLILISAHISFAQKTAPVYSLCGKTGDCSMTWDEFSKCKKELVATNKGLSIGSFILTITKLNKKDSVYVEFPAKGNAFSKSALETIEQLHKDKKLGTKMLIEAVQVLESGKEAKKVSGMVIMLN
jgi:hypothetical protein